MLFSRAVMLTVSSAREGFRAERMKGVLKGAYFENTLF